MSEVYNYRRLEENLEAEDAVKEFLGSLTVGQFFTVISLAEGVSSYKLANNLEMTHQAISERMAAIRNKAIEAFGEQAVAGRDPNKRAPIGERRR